MALNRDAIGKEYSGFEWDVTKERIMDYTRAYGDDNPAFLENYDDKGIVAPPMFAVVFQLEPVMTPLFDQDVGVNMMKLVHGEQAMKFHKLVRPGDKVLSKCVILGMEEKSSGELLELEVTSTDQQGEILVVSNGVMFIRGKKKKDKSEVAEEKAGKKDLKAWEEKEAGFTGGLLLERTIVTDKDQPDRYSQASGDMNPIHLDDDFARSVGLPGRIMHGLCTMAICQKVLIDGMCDRDPARLKSFKVRFSGMVVPGEGITTRVWKVEEKSGEMAVGLDARTSEDNYVITKADAVISTG
ncbi:MAG: hypothetical protein GXP49_05245 [Deltaproteobacteria bacterium]|nr:hypothetical protein [Deltaproteobacteria bacterium]